MLSCPVPAPQRARTGLPERSGWNLLQMFPVGSEGPRLLSHVPSIPCAHQGESGRHVPHVLPAFLSHLFSRDPWPDSVREAMSLGIRRGAEGARWSTRPHVLHRPMRLEDKEDTLWPQPTV